MSTCTVIYININIYIYMYLYTCSYTAYRCFSFPGVRRMGMRMQKDYPNFREIAPIFLHGRMAKGSRLICPRDGLPGCSSCGSGKYSASSQSKEPKTSQVLKRGPFSHLAFLLMHCVQHDARAILLLLSTKKLVMRGFQHDSQACPLLRWCW